MNAYEVHAKLKEIKRDYINAANAILNQCEDMECPECSKIICSFECPYHFHHDGCPMCSELYDKQEQL